MSAKTLTKAVPKPKKLDIEKKGKSLRKAKKTSIGDSRNSHPTDKRSVRERKGR